MARSLPFVDRYAALAPRERKLVAVGAAAVLLFVLYLLLRGGGGATGGESAVELVNEPAFAPLPQPAIYAAPPPVVVPPPVGAAPAVPVASLQGLVLAGVLGGGAAIFSDAGGPQRVVRIGRDAVPGATLKEVGLRHVVLATSGGDMRLEFGKSAQPQAAPAAAPAAAIAPAGEREQTLQFQLGLAPQRSGGRTTGYAIRPGAELPVLRGAGLQPGDVITRVNGSILDEERLQELAWQIANSERVDFDYRRDGRQFKTTLPAQSR